MLQALIFDFDGLLLDTETPEVQTWQALYRQFGFELPMHEWHKIIGGYGLSDFDPAAHLVQLTGRKLDKAELRLRYRAQADEKIAAQPLLPGALDLLRAAKREGLKLAVGSSSSHLWVDAHTKRLGIYEYFDCLVCSDDVPAGRTKPHADIYIKVLERLAAPSRAAVVFEDSPNGVLAAQRAGIFAVAVPNPLTAAMNVRGDWTVPSLAEISLRQLETAIKAAYVRAA
ncbi:MAG: HAD family hydrolase [Anaerolineales bacterium]